MGKLILLAVLILISTAIQLKKTIEIKGPQSNTHYLGKFAVGEDKQFLSWIRAKIGTKGNIPFLKAAKSSRQGKIDKYPYLKPDIESKDV